MLSFADEPPPMKAQRGSIDYVPAGHNAKRYAEGRAAWQCAG